jgi:hypothetical protein
MVNKHTFIQANLQHSIAASRILARTVSGKGIDVALKKEPWYRENCIRGLNIPGYTLHSAGGTDRPRACVLVRFASSWILPGFSGRDLVLVKYLEDGTERRVVICSAYLPYDAKDPPSRELEELVRYCEEHLHLIVGCDSNAHHDAWGSTDCNGRVEALVEFLDASGLEILNWGNEPTFFNRYRSEVIDITLGFFGLLDNIENLEVSMEPSLSDHRHILFTLRGSLPAHQSRNPRGADWDSFQEELRGSLSRGPIDYTRYEAGLGLALQWLQHALITAYENNCPMWLVKPARNSLRWTARLESLRRRVRRLFKKGRRNRTPRSWELYRQAQ